MFLCRRLIFHRVEQKAVDPMAPLVPGGCGRTCRWKGLEAPFHDGGGLSIAGKVEDVRQRPRREPYRLR